MSKTAKVFFGLAGIVSVGMLVAALVRLYQPQWAPIATWWAAVTTSPSEELETEQEVTTEPGDITPRRLFSLGSDEEGEQPSDETAVLTETITGPTYVTRNTYNEYVTNNVNNSTNNTVLSLNDLNSDRLLFVNGSDNVEALDSGISGQILQSRGSGTTPTWVSASSGTVDWANPGSIGSGTANTGEFTGLSVFGESTALQVGTGSPLKILDTGRLEIAYQGDSGYLSSSGGALYINNTNNVGTGIGIYSNAGGEAEGNMINVKVDNPLYNQAAFYMNYDGLSNAVEIVNNTNDESSNALAVTGNNILDSTVGIIGYELGKGTIKVTHNRPGTGNDQNASGLSIDLKGSGTRAQGVYVDSTEVGGTLGNLLRLRNESIDKFVVGPTGNVTVAGNITQGANGTDTTYTKRGNTSGDEFFVGTTGAFRVQRSAGNSEAFRTQVSGDTQGRWLGTSDGQLKWGPGNATQDVTLRRGSTGTLFVDGALFINNLNQDLDTVIKGVTDSNLLHLDSSTDRIGVGISTPSDKLHVAGALRVTGAFKDSNNSAGSSGYLLTSTGSGTSWVDPSSLSIGDASTLDTLDSSQFLRSDTTDSYTSGTLTFDSGTALVVSGDLSVADTDIALTGASTNLSATGNLSINTDDLVILKASGNVGIGSTSPSALLTVGSTAPFTVASTGNVSQGVNGANTTFTKLGNTAGDQFLIGTNAAFSVQRSSSGSEAFRTQVSGDTQGRWLGTSDGQLKWGSGSATQDVVLRRDSAGKLALEGSILINNLNADADTVIKGVSDSNLLFIDASANAVGIGVSTPSDKLHVAGALRVTGAFKDASNAAGSSGYVLTSTGTGTSWVDPGTLAVGNAATLDSLDSLQFLRSDATDAYTSGTLTFDSGTALVVNGDFSTADTDIELTGTTTNLTATGDFSINTDDFVVLKSSGNVGIGTAAPDSVLDVRQLSDASDAFSLRRFTDTSPTGTLLRFNDATGGLMTFFGTYGEFHGQALTEAFDSYFDGGNWYFRGSGSDSTRIGSNNDTDIELYPQGDGNVLIRSGNLGINNTDPALLLDAATNENAINGLQVTNSNSGNLAAGLVNVRSNSHGGGIVAFSTGYNGGGSVGHLAGRLALYTDLNNPSAGIDLLSTSASGDIRFYTGGIGTANERLRIDSSGNITHGANGLNTTFTKRGNTAGDEFFIGTNGAFRAQRSSSGSEAFRTQVNGDTQGRWVGTSDGRLSWGPGNAATDVTLRRGAANSLYMNGNFVLEDTTRNLGIGTTAFGTSSNSVLAIANSVAPTTSITDGIQLFAVDQAGSHELRVRDEAGNVTTLSPHNFSLIDDGPSESLAWAYYSERNGVAINADMTKALRLVEKLSGEQIVHLENLSTGQVLGTTDTAPLNLSQMSWITQLQDHYIAPTVNQATQGLVPRAELVGLVEWGDQVWTTVAEAVFKAKATFQAGITVWGRAVFKGSITVDKNTAGKVVIPAGSAGITVQFAQPFSETPVVYVTPVSVVDAKYGVTEVSATGFKLQLLQPLAQDVEFSWLAVMVEEGNGAQVQTMPVSSPTPTPTPTSSPSPTATPTASPEPTVSPEPTTSPTPSATPTPTAETSPDASTSATTP